MASYAGFRKIYYIFLYIFLTIVIFSYRNIAGGGSVLWSNPEVFYLVVAVTSISLIYFIFNSKDNCINIKEQFATFLFCSSLGLLFVIGSGDFPFDLDSILSMQSIDLISKIGFSTNLLSQGNFLIDATYSLPILSILGSNLTAVLNVNHITIAKFTPLILISVFFLIYYAFISDMFNKKVALLSLLLISTFYDVVSYSGIFSNAVLGYVLIILSWWLLYWRYFNGNSLKITFLQIVLILTFVMSHHLTYIFFISSLVIFLILFHFSENYQFTQQRNLIIFLQFAIISMFTYYIFVYISPLSTIVDSFTNQLLVEGATGTAPTSWTRQIILQRIIWVIFIIIPTYVSIVEIKTGFKEFLRKKYANFLITGGFLFLLGLLGVLMRVPYNWTRVAIFGWLLFIPGTIAIFIESSMMKKIVLQRFAIFLMFLLLIGNIFVIPTNILDHTGDNEYKDGFKNWIKVQEWYSGVWLNSSMGDGIYGDETFRRIYLINNPNVVKNNYLVSDVMHFEYLNNYNETKNIKFSYLIYRKENLYQIIGNFYKKKGENNEIENINRSTYNKFVSNKALDNIYNNDDVIIFYLIPNLEK